MVHLREATSADLDAICELGEEVNLLHHQDSPGTFAGPGDPKRHLAHWQSSVAKPESTTFVAEVNGVVVGFITIAVSTESHSLLQPICFGKIGTVGVALSERGKGIGTQLLRKAEIWSAAKGAKEIRLTVGTFNERAIHLYKELGYEEKAIQLSRRL